MERSRPRASTALCEAPDRRLDKHIGNVRPCPTQTQSRPITRRKPPAERSARLDQFAPEIGHDYGDAGLTARSDAMRELRIIEGLGARAPEASPWRDSAARQERGSDVGDDRPPWAVRTPPPPALPLALRQRRAAHANSPSPDVRERLGGEKPRALGRMFFGFVAPRENC